MTLWEYLFPIIRGAGLCWENGHGLGNTAHMCGLSPHYLSHVRRGNIKRMRYLTAVKLRQKLPLDLDAMAGYGILSRPKKYVDVSHYKNVNNADDFEQLDMFGKPMRDDNNDGAVTTTNANTWVYLTMNKCYEVSLYRVRNANGSVDICSEFKEVSVIGKEELFRERAMEYNKCDNQFSKIDGENVYRSYGNETETMKFYVIANDDKDALCKIAYILLDYIHAGAVTVEKASNNVCASGVYRAKKK